jgi:hypothetical protein
MGKMTFNGRSQELKQTQVVPTLTSPIKNGHNVVWCASFLSAWKSLQKSIAEEPVWLENADEHCMPLNEANDPKNSLPPGALYAVAGWVQKGVVETIHETVKKMFPGFPPKSRLYFRVFRTTHFWPMLIWRQMYPSNYPISRIRSH